MATQTLKSNERSARSKKKTISQFLHASYTALPSEEGNVVKPSLRSHHLWCCTYFNMHFKKKHTYWSLSEIVAGTFQREIFIFWSIGAFSLFTVGNRTCSSKRHNLIFKISATFKTFRALLRDKVFSNLVQRELAVNKYRSQVNYVLYHEWHFFFTSVFFKVSFAEQEMIPFATWRQKFMTESRSNLLNIHRRILFHPYLATWTASTATLPTYRRFLWNSWLYLSGYQTDRTQKK